MKDNFAARTGTFSNYERTRCACTSANQPQRKLRSLTRCSKNLSRNWLGFLGCQLNWGGFASEDHFDHDGMENCTSAATVSASVELRVFVFCSLDDNNGAFKLLAAMFFACFLAMAICPLVALQVVVGTVHQEVQ